MVLNQDGRWRWGNRIDHFDVTIRYDTPGVVIPRRRRVSTSRSSPQGVVEMAGRDGRSDEPLKAKRRPASFLFLLLEDKE